MSVMQVSDPPLEAASHLPAPNDDAPNPSGTQAPPAPPLVKSEGFEYKETSFRRHNSSRKQVLRSACSQLEGLPPEVLWRVLSFLSADDLATCAAVSHSLRIAAAGEAPGVDHLWRRLWCARYAIPTTFHTSSMASITGSYSLFRAYICELSCIRLLCSMCVLRIISCMQGLVYMQDINYVLALRELGGLETTIAQSANSLDQR